MSEAQAGYGTKFYVWSDGAYEAFAEIVRITGPGVTRDTIDVSAMDNTTGYRDCLVGMADGAEVSFDLNFLPNNALIKLVDDLPAPSGDEYHLFKIEWPDESNIEFAGYLAGFEPSASIDSPLRATVRVKVTGELTDNS